MHRRSPETAVALSSIVVVLVTPRDATNVGAVVRVMGNFGLRYLRLVEPAAFDAGRALALAHRGAAVVEALTRYNSLAEATADCGLVVGTTARARAVRHEVLAPWQTAQVLLEAVAENGAGTGQLSALVFGPEDTGLTNEDLALCHAMSTIPTAPEDWSLNLGQAVLLHLYELWLAATVLEGETSKSAQGWRATIGQAITSAASTESLAAGAQREEMFSALEAMLRAMHPHTDGGRLGSMMERLRAVLLRAAPRADETRLLTGVFQHVAHALRRLQVRNDAVARQIKGRGRQELGQRVT